MHRRTAISFIVALCCATMAATPARADDDPGYLPGPWHYKAVSCVDTTVKTVYPRLGEPGQTHFTPEQFKETGVEVTFNTSLGIRPLFASGLAEVVHYQGVAGNDVMAAEHPGDRVQVCYLGGPAPTKYCNPDSDDRGRTYRVYDYRQKQQYWGLNGEHGCGGA
jgi:hypothetical protein